MGLSVFWVSAKWWKACLGMTLMNPYWTEAPHVFYEGGGVIKQLYNIKSMNCRCKDAIPVYWFDFSSMVAHHCLSLVRNPLQLKSVMPLLSPMNGTIHNWYHCKSMLIVLNKSMQNGENKSHSSVTFSLWLFFGGSGIQSTKRVIINSS